MKRSTDRILTTHTGSLPRPPDLLAELVRCDRGEAVDAAALDTRVREAVADSVRRQAAARIAVVNDGEVVWATRGDGRRRRSGVRRAPVGRRYTF
jgi:5-methyltetrahydropteroyltriglutamate--homocysteine methyltransferase